MSDIDAILTGAKLPEDRVPVCTRSDLVVEWKRLAQEVAQTKLTSAADPRLAGDGTADKVRRMEELRAEVEAATVEFRVRALRRKRWAELVEAHPPRSGDDDDMRMGVNRATFLPALVRASTVEPELADGTWTALLDPDAETLTTEQWRRWWRACWALNVEQVDVPFSVAGLLPTPTSGNGSGSPEPSV